MKALLVNPYIYDVSAYDYWLKPVGLLYIATALEKSGVEVKLLDFLDRHLPGNNVHDGPYGTGKFSSIVVKSLMNEYGIPRYLKRYGAPEEILNTLNFSPDVVLITSMMTYWYGGVFETIKMIKKNFNVPVILGGNYPTLLPEHAKLSGADVIVEGDGIPKIYDILEAVTGTKVEHTVGENWFEEITPDNSLYPKIESAVIHTTFGCPYRCTYCVAWKKGFKVRPVNSVLKEIQELKKRGVKDIAFYDDALLVKRERFKKILKGLPNDIRYHLPNGIHAALLDEEIAKLLKEKNFHTIRLGYETGDAALQKKTGGKVDNTSFQRAVELLKSVGFDSKDVGAYMIVGLQDQSFESALEDVKFLARMGVKPVINEYTLIPGSLDWQVALNQGLVDENVDPFMLNNSLISYWWKGSMGIKKIDILKNVVRRFVTGKISLDELLKFKV